MSSKADFRTQPLPSAWLHKAVRAPAPPAGAQVQFTNGHWR